jgi:hypothetical protein
MGSGRPKKFITPLFQRVHIKQIVGLHEAAIKSLQAQAGEYHPPPDSLRSLHVDLIETMLITHPIGVLVQKKDPSYYRCISAIRTYLLLRESLDPTREVPVMIFPHMKPEAISKMVEIDLFISPYVTGPYWSSYQSHASYWAFLQKKGKLSATRPENDGCALFQEFSNIPSKLLRKPGERRD